MGLAYDPEKAIERLSATDPHLARLIERVGPFRLEVRDGLSPFQALVRSIIYQQLSGRAAATIYGRVLALFPGEPMLVPQHLLDAPEDVLREAGLSRAKVAAVRDLSAKTLDGTVPSLEVLRTMDDEAIIKRLTAVRGVGRWTVEMLLIFRLSRPDVLPVHDLGVRRGFQCTYGLDALPVPKALQAHGERWRPYRSVASWYLWRAADGG